MYFSTRFSEKWKKSCENWTEGWVGESKANATRDDGICKSPCTSLFPPLFSIPPFSRLNLHLPISAPLICKPYAPFFPGAWLKGAVHFTLARTFLLTPAGFNKKFKSRRPANTWQSSISALRSLQLMLVCITRNWKVHITSFYITLTSAKTWKWFRIGKLIILWKNKGKLILLKLIFHLKCGLAY